ncbi:hypothetical protein DH2020_025746 [Rehmannia glutinosa]|uniref:Pentatricopeptide repeat-containing protein n=1 Tax=Rehmannia glutinosa TaxID=99300 RepID=A0ABR0W1L4_REHGL
MATIEQLPRLFVVNSALAFCFVLVLVLFSICYFFMKEDSSGDPVLDVDIMKGFSRESVHLLPMESLPSTLQLISPIQQLKVTACRADTPTENTATLREFPRKSKYISHEAAIDLIRREKNPEHALEIFNKVSIQKGFQHNNSTYAIILHKLAQYKKYQSLDAVLHQMTYETCKFHEGDLESAFEVVKEMEKSEMSCPNLITYSTLIDGLCGNGRLEEAINLFEEMVSKHQIVPDALTYNLLINGFCRGGKTDRARKIMDFMKKNGCNPNAFNYSSLMNGLCRDGKFEEAKEIFIEMKGVGLTPDTVIYTTLINCLCRAGRTDEAIELLKEMKENDCRADEVTFNVILGGLCREYRYYEALNMLERLPNDGVYLNKASYRIVLNFLCKEGELEKAVELLILMLHRGFLPHFRTSNELLVSLCEAGNANDAATLLFGLVEMGFKPEPFTWSIVIDLVFTERKLLPAFELLDKLLMKDLCLP